MGALYDFAADRQLAQDSQQGTLGPQHRARDCGISVSASEKAASNFGIPSPRESSFEEWRCAVVCRRVYAGRQRAREMISKG